MSEFKLGDIVARKSYGYDILFKVVDIIECEDDDNIAVLRGVTERLKADAPESDLVLRPKECADKCRKTMKKLISSKTVAARTSLENRG